MGIKEVLESILWQLLRGLKLRLLRLLLLNLGALLLILYHLKDLCALQVILPLVRRR